MHMTLGERIQLKRKELGMSQETLGEKLSVSRQTVYKWETGLVTPELNNLLAMAEIFQVTVGWLIAEEESPEREKDYDAIIEKIAAVSQPKRRNPLPAILGCAVLLAAFAGFGMAKLAALERKYDALDRQIQNSNYYIQQEIAQITGNVKQALKDFGSITLNSDIKLTGFDFANNTMSIKLTAQPKEYSDGMAAVFHVDRDGHVTDYEAEENNKVFTTDATAPLSAGTITVTVEYISGGRSETSEIARFIMPSMYTWHFYDIVWPTNTAINSAGTGFDETHCQIIDYGCNYLEPLFDGIEIPNIVKMEMWLTEDGEKIAEYTLDETYQPSGPKPDLSAWDQNDLPVFYYFKRPDGLTLDPSKTYEEHLLLTDEYGRQLEVISTPDGQESHCYAG